MIKKLLIVATVVSGVSWSAFATPDKSNRFGISETFLQKMAEAPGMKRDKALLRERTGIDEVTEDETSQEVIYAPEGVEKPYTKSIMGLDWGENIQEDACTSIVFGEDGEVYFRDIILRVASLGFGSYVKGYLKDGKITVSLPQMLVEYEGGYGREVVLMEKGSTGEWEVSPINEITYTYNEKTGVIMSQLPGSPGKYAIAMKWTFTDSWDQIGDFMQIYTPYDGEFMTVPENVSLEEYYLNDGYYAYPVQVGVDGDALYIKGLSEASPNSVIKAVADGNKGYIPQNELLGTIMGYFIWTKMMVPDPVLGWALVSPDETYRLEIDMEQKVIKSADPTQILIYNCEYDRVFYLDGFTDFALMVPDSFAGTPQNPFGISWDGEEFREYYGINGFHFNISNVSKEGSVLESTGLYYSIYIDGDILEFEEIENFNGIMYPGVKGIVTRMPFDFSNGYDIDTESATGKFVGIYPDGVTTIGVQAIYEYEGRTTYSDIVTLNVDTGEFTDGSKVAPIKTEEVVSTVYYDLSGRKVANPSKGIYIMLQTLSDGTVRTGKTAIN